jgi:hypothetical protein
MSLSYQAEHLAWKQRVVQEMTRSNQFYKTWDSLERTTNSSRTPRSNLPANPNLLRDSPYIDPRRYEVVSQRDSRSHSSTGYHKLNPKLQKLFDENNYKNANVNLGYSFGGRFHVSNAFKTSSESGDINSNKSNRVITRPSTANSLVAKSRRHKSRPSTRQSEPIPQAPTRPLARESEGPRIRKMKTLKSSKSQPVEKSLAKEAHRLSIPIKNSIKEVHISDEAEVKDETLDTEEGPESPVKMHEQEEGSESPERKSDYPKSESSYAYRKYIEELKKLLDEERSKRIQAEKRLKRIS